MISHPIAGFWRRLAAAVYDALILVALLMVASALALLVSELAIPGLNTRQPDALRQHPLYLGWLLLLWFGYYAWSWRKVGQTVGMKAWRLQLFSQLPAGLQLWQINFRLLVAGFVFAVALAGYTLLSHFGPGATGFLPFALILMIQVPALAVHERLSHTAVRVLAKPVKSASSAS